MRMTLRDGMPEACKATLAALERGRVVLNVCDDEPAPMAEWLPYAARVLGDSVAQATPGHRS